ATRPVSTGMTTPSPGCITIIISSYGRNTMGRRRTIETGSAREVAMRYGKGHKQATRQRILEAAGRRFKRDGIDGAGVAAVMYDAGVTNRAFHAYLRHDKD